MADSAKRFDRVGVLREATLTSPGTTTRSLRAAACTRAASHGGAAPPAPGELGAGLPDELRAYVDKVARHAYRVTDADIDALRACGYSEDQIFEITVSAALGAGLARLERGVAALAGEVD